LRLSFTSPGIGNGSDPSKTPPQRRNERPSWQIAAPLLLGLLTYYLGDFLSYRPYDVDNPWFLSFSYNACVEHVATDQFMHIPFPAGMDGTQLFGRLAAFTQCGVLNHFGWQQRPAVVLSAAMVVLALGFWWLQLARLGFSRLFIASFVLIAGISEPFLAAANKFRYEFLSFALISLGLLLVARRKPLLGIFIAALAVEVQPAAVVGLVPIVLLASSLEKIDRRLIARLIAGASLAACVYLALHPDILHASTYLAQLHDVPRQAHGGTFVAYFIERTRHLPELLCIIIAAFLYPRRPRTPASRYIGISALVLSCLLVVLPHGNAAYMIFTYPFLLAMALIAFDVDRHPRLIISGALLLALPQSLYLAHLTRNLGYRPADIAEASQAIQRAETTLHIPDDRLRIYGDYRLWFAHPHFYQAAAESTTPEVRDADLYLCFNHPPEPLALAAHTMLDCPAINALVPLRLLDTISVRDHQLFLYARK
jgi:hypothetical protein